VLKSAVVCAQHKQPEIAFTFDDPKTDEGAGLSWQEINHRILAALAKHRIKAVLFVTGKRVDSEEGRQLVAAWDKDGHAIANHSYSHLPFNSADVTLTQFESDFLRDGPLIHDYPRFEGFFRFPYFKEGDTAEKRDGMRSFLHQQGYRIGRATIDASDWGYKSKA
jgi:peptidoglycan/xylan/chitin deacetylase (PgdA/CDA1 family)